MHSIVHPIGFGPQAVTCLSPPPTRSGLSNEGRGRAVDEGPRIGSPRGSVDVHAAQRRAGASAYCGYSFSRGYRQTTTPHDTAIVLIEDLSVKVLPNIKRYNNTFQIQIILYSYIFNQIVKTQWAPTKNHAKTSITIIP